MKYSIDMHEMVFPKYAKLILGINKSGNFILSASPSLTVGRMPEGARGGKIPKGTKTFNYDQEVVVSFNFSDCLKMIDFAKKRNVEQTLDFFRNSDRFNKKVTFKYTLSDDDATKPKMLTIFFSATGFINKEQREINFYLPMSLAHFDEMIEGVKSYVNDFAMIKLFCLSEEE